MSAIDPTAAVSLVVPAALLIAAAALAGWAFLSGGLPLHPLFITIALIAGLPLAMPLPPVAIGLASGTAVALAVRTKGRRQAWLVGLGLLAYLLVILVGMPALYPSGRR